MCVYAYNDTEHPLRKTNELITKTLTDSNHSVTRQSKPEAAPFPLLAPHANLSAMALDDGMNDRESKTCSASALAAARLVHTIESIEDASMMLLRNAWTTIGDGELNESVTELPCL
jgi:hypothetical protein